VESISLEELEELRAVAFRAVRSGMDVVRGWRNRGESSVLSVLRVTLALLVREAGGLATGLSGCLDVWRSDVVLAGTPQTHHDLCAVLQGVDD